MKQILIIFGILIALVMLGLMLLMVVGDATQTGMNNSEVKSGSRYREIVNPSGFVNTNGEAVMLSNYIGKKVILLEFMTYTCVTCQGTFPHLVKWHDSYKDAGLIIIAIHTPQYAFEKEIGNVEKAMAKSKITFPVVLDNDYSTWNTYGNRLWPHRYLIDLGGTVVYEHAGEGGYEETEALIESLLKK